jgi:hypothetical protein
MMTKKAVYLRDDYVRGVEAAAGVIEQYNSSTTHPYRLDDCVLCKLNVTKRAKPRRNTTKLASPKDTWVQGFATALAEMHRRLLGGNDSDGVRAVACEAGITLAIAKKAGVSSYDWRELRRAGVAK